MHISRRCTLSPVTGKQTMGQIAFGKCQCPDTVIIGESVQVRQSLPQMSLSSFSPAFYHQEMSLLQSVLVVIVVYPIAVFIRALKIHPHKYE